jgi:hypothetical protein
MLRLTVPEARARIDRVDEGNRAQRDASRRKIVRVRRATTPEAPSRLSIVQNVTKQGLVLLLTYPVPPGTVLEIEMHGLSVVKRFARALHSTKQSDGWAVDCSLNQSLSDSDLEHMLSCGD